MYPVDLPRFVRLACAISVTILAVGCSTTEEQVREQIDILAANDVGSQAHDDAVEALTTIGRPAARQLVALLNPGLYRGVQYREFRDELERTLTGAAIVLGRIRHKAASASMKDRISVAYRDNERRAALRAVGELGFNPAAVTALEAQLKDADPVIRLLAAVALVKLEETAAGDTILHAVLSEDDNLATIAIAELEQANYHGVPLLVELRDDARRGAAVTAALGTVRDQLIAQLADDDPDIRQASASALGAVGDEEATRALLGLLEDPSNRVRFHAASSLVRLGNDNGADFLFVALADDDPILRLNAIKSLVRVQQLGGTVEARLLACLTQDDPALRSGAAQVLGQAKVHSALSALLALVGDDDPRVRWNTAIALGHLALPAGRDALDRLSADDDETVAYYAQWALTRLGAGS